MTPKTLIPTRSYHYYSIFLLSASIILWEILLTRIYSVLLYYHFAFMAVSVAMFGLTLGATFVALSTKPVGAFTSDDELGYLALATGWLIAVAISVQISMAPPLRGAHGLSALLLRTYILSALPFIPAGAYVCRVLTTHQNVSRLYAADLLGAGSACALIPCALTQFGGPGAVLVAAAIGCLAAFIQIRRRKVLKLLALASACGLAILGSTNSRYPLLSVRWRVTGLPPPPLYEKWNAFSRIIIYPVSDTAAGWGIDDSLRDQFQPVRQLMLEIDSGAATPLTQFNGRFESVRHLRYDITGFVHYLRPHGSVLVIGPGGGRDVLTALSFHHSSIKGVEVNGAILHAVNQVFGDFTGHLDQQPGVQFVNDEGRSYLQGTAEHFDIIQASLVDTAAATAAGAYAFIENALYTTEAWELFLNKLTPDGILSFSRWYYGTAPWPVEVGRLLALATESLRSIGIQSPASHLLLIRNSHANPDLHGGIATLLISRSPFTAADYEMAKETCRVLRCDVALADGAGDPFLMQVVNAQDTAALYASLPLDISPPNDNKPYFFFFARLKDFLTRPPGEWPNAVMNLPSLHILLQLIAVTMIIAILLVAAPRWVLHQRYRDRPRRHPMAWTMPVYFGLIGMAFMFIEMALMQRFSLFLGHPTYGFTVILFGLLLMTGVGSFMEPPLTHWLLIPCIIGADLVSPWILHHTAATNLGVRIVVTWLLIGGPAFLMGFYFPAGMKRAQQMNDPLTPWYWSVNGALSVVGSVLAIISLLAFGAHETIWLGAILYVGAASLLTRMKRTEQRGVSLG